MIDEPLPLTGPRHDMAHGLVCNTCGCKLTGGLADIDDACMCRCHEAPRLYRRLAREPMCDSSEQEPSSPESLL